MTVPYKTIVAVHAWKLEAHADGTMSQTYADPTDENIDGWNVHLEHRSPDGDDLVDYELRNEKLPDLDVDTEDYASAYLIADALASKHGWELREY